MPFMPVIVLVTSGTTWTVPNNFTSVNFIDCIGAGSSNGTGSGTAGAFARIANSNLTPGSSAHIKVDLGDGASFTWLRIDGGTTQPATTAQGVAAQSASGNQSGNASSSIGTTTFNGGGSSGVTTGGGGAAGPFGAGANHSGTTGGQGDNGHGGTGGTSGNPGNNGAEYVITAGGTAGAGGGGGSGSGGHGGLYGAGCGSSDSTPAQGAIIITYFIWVASTDPSALPPGITSNKEPYPYRDWNQPYETILLNSQIRLFSYSIPVFPNVGVV